MNDARFFVSRICILKAYFFDVFFCICHFYRFFLKFLWGGVNYSISMI